MIPQAKERTLTMKTDYTKYTETKTWRAWQGSVLSNFQPNSDGTKPLFALLLAATSSNNLERLSTSEFLNDTCRPSVGLRKALKRIWQVMRDNDERWVIAAASLEGLGLGLGFISFHWGQLSQGKPVIQYASGQRRHLFDQPWEDSDWLNPHPSLNEIHHDYEIFLPTEQDKESYEATVNLGSTKDFLNRVEIEFYYPNQNEIFVVMVFNMGLFTENNVIPFKRMMSQYSLVELPSGFAHHNDPVICYRFRVTYEERAQAVEFKNILVGHLHRQLYFQPKEGFIKFIEKKLHDAGVSLIGAITVSR